MLLDAMHVALHRGELYRRNQFRAEQFIALPGMAWFPRGVSDAPQDSNCDFRS
jgi:hypothetical protein